MKAMSLIDGEHPEIESPFPLTKFSLLGSLPTSYDSNRLTYMLLLLGQYCKISTIGLCISIAYKESWN
jgi:hypothetical protein